MVELVWFKRDLRVHDHAPLSAAIASATERGGSVLPVFFIEPGYWQGSDTSARQYQFAVGSALDLRESLRRLNLPLWIVQADAPQGLAELQNRFGICALYSHQESGNDWTYTRDRAVTEWAKAAGVAWHEYRQFGVLRGLRLRGDWAGRWEKFMRRSVIASPHSQTVASAWHDAPEANYVPDFRAVLNSSQRWNNALAEQVRPAHGRTAARSLFHSFLNERGEHYTRAMSSPLSAADACSRLSPHLTWGNLSMREVYQATLRAQKRLEEGGVNARTGRSKWASAYRSFAARLHWHCHFIQKLESEPALEFANVHHGFDQLRTPHGNTQEYLQAWQQGLTGWPFVDACMRSLNATGWLNFRMRAMLVSIASYPLWLHWREPGLHLARQFVDLEPGIHWSQMQMQAGTTGINIPRIYHPIKQSVIQDPRGTFIRQWVPEVAHLPDAFVHQPWLSGAKLDYPHPLVEHESAARLAKARFTECLQQAHMLELSIAVMRKHGSRRRKLSAPRALNTAKKSHPQLNLFEQTP
jgi:deoxyribodipyrimidine photo-lyase